MSIVARESSDRLHEGMRRFDAAGGCVQAQPNNGVLGVLYSVEGLRYGWSFGRGHGKKIRLLLELEGAGSVSTRSGV